MGHLEGYLDGVLDEAAELAVVLVPGGLVDEFLHLGAIGQSFLDGVGVKLLVLEQAFKFRLGGLGVAVHQVVADDLVAGALNELETSLLLDKSEVTWNSRFTGMAIVKDDEEEDTWLLTYEGPFTIDGCTYETRFSIVAAREDIMEGQHGDWNVTVTGTRVEKEGYSCKFDNVGSLTYLTDGSRTGWNQIYGKLSMAVIKDNARIDTGLLVFNGAPSTAQFVRGL